MILLPTAVLPVKDIRWTSGCCTRGSPALGPTPNTTLTTPGGSPLFWNGNIINGNRNVNDSYLRKGRTKNTNVRSSLMRTVERGPDK